jgi:hypothetical protein
MNEVWLLKRGETTLATLTLQEIDQPFFDCLFEAGEGYSEIAYLFEEQLRLTSDHESLEDGRWSRAYQRILDLNLELESPKQERFHKFILNIDPPNARFRYSSNKPRSDLSTSSTPS